VHDARTLTAQGTPLIPPEATRAAIYVVRNPLDVAISAAHHFNVGLDASIDRLANEDLVIARAAERPSPQVQQRLLSWSGHVRSWLDGTGFRVHLMRYEDMCREPEPTFRAAAAFLGLTDDPERVARAVLRSRFEEVQAQEQSRGFKERPASMAGAFFRQGRAGAWREVLTPEQVARIVRDHGPVMRRLGYLSEAGELRC
jgi:hypothetical protein